MLTSTEPASLGTVAGAALPRLFQLASPALPVGAFAYSEGLERAVEDGLVNDEASARDWILGLLEHCVSRLDLPLLVRLHAAWQANDEARARELSRWLLACRDTAELRATDRQLGQALARVLEGLGDAGAGAWLRERDATFAALFARAAARWAIPVRDATAALAWTWCENMTAAAIKLVPLGQSAGQRLLFDAGSRIPSLCDEALQLPDAAIAGGAPGLAIASARHETQRTRLFRS